MVGDFYACVLSFIRHLNDQLRTFTNYLIDKYNDFNSHFPLEMWAEMSSSMQLTTNACESFHLKFNSFLIHVKQTHT